MKNKIPKADPLLDKCTVSHKWLAKASNLTERRLRQLVEEKRLPAPTNGEFPTLETLSALFTYYQDSGEEYSRERTLKLAAQRKRQELALAVEQGAMVNKEALAGAINKIASQAKAILYGKLENEYPLAVAKLDVPEARIYGGRLADAICEAMQGLGSELDHL